jgi:hypothetical protein
VNREGQVWSNSLAGVDLNLLWVVVRSEGGRHMVLCLEAAGHTATVKENELATGEQLGGYITWERFS